jgi:hypothetical protein
MKGIVLSELLNEAKTEEAPKLKPIEFVKVATLNNSGYAFFDAGRFPKDYESVILLECGYAYESLDAMWATGHNGASAFYLGHWNDGVAE